MIFWGFLVDAYFVTCLILYHERANAASRYLYKVSFFVTVFQSFLVFALCTFYLVGFCFSGGNRKLPVSQLDGVTLDETNDLCRSTESFIEWEKLVTSEEEKELVAVE